MSAEFDLSDEPRQFAKGSSALAYGLSSNAKNLGVWPRYGARLIPRKIARFKPCIFIPSSLFAFKLALWQRRILDFHPHKSPVGIPTRRGRDSDAFWRRVRHYHLAWYDGRSQGAGTDVPEFDSPSSRTA
jgi:hypothetical protein